MGLFSATAPCEIDVEKATDEKNPISKEDWGLILEICDKASKSSQNAKEYLKALLKRINHVDPHVAIQAVTVLDACVKNSGKVFHLEVASRDFETEYSKLLKKAHPTVIRKLKECLKKWAEDEFKTDPQLNLIPSLYDKLKGSGVNFDVEEPTRRAVTLSKDPNVVQSQEEEDQIAKAIELSLKESGGSPRTTSNAASSLYPSANMTPAVTAKEPKKVRAVYDFEAAEDNELTFNSGEIIFIIDDSDPNWWKGSNQRGEGLFPANFVTSDLNVDPTKLAEEKHKKMQEIDAGLDRKLEEMRETEATEIDESKIDRLLHLLHEADPTSPEHDTMEMLNLEREVNSMGGLIDKELERVDHKHAQLTQLSADLVEALSLYHSLMREPQFTGVSVKQTQPMPPPSMQHQYRYPPPPGPHQNAMPPMSYNGGPPPAHQQPPPQMMYNTLPHERSYGPPPPQGANVHPNYSTLPNPNMMHPPPPVSQHPQPPPPQGIPPLNIHQSLPPLQQQQQQQPPPSIPPTQGDPRTFHHAPGFSGGPFPQSGSFSLPPTSNLM